MPANVDQPPGLFASNASGVAGHGSPYNYYPQPGAAGRLSPAPYTTGQAGGTSCAKPEPTAFGVMAPNNGGSFDYGKCGSPARSLGMGAGKQAGGRKRKTRRRGKKFKKGTKSKTHSGKDFETRKSSKRYGEKRWRKFLRGRKTMIAPDFPFAGGQKRDASQLDREEKFGCFPNSSAVKLWLGSSDFQCGDGDSPTSQPVRQVRKAARQPGRKAARVTEGGYRYSQKRKQGRRKSMRGGYHVPGSNVPNAPSYSTGGSLHGGLSALANPVPYQRLDNCIANNFPIRH